jgi:hypothetical protein
MLTKSVIPLVVALSLPATAGTRDDGVPDSRYLALGDQFAPYTAQISGTTPERVKHSATAVVIAPRWAITAAHVVAGCDNVAVRYGADVRRQVVSVIVHPDWKPNALQAADVALCQLDADAGLPWYPQLAGEIAPGSVCLIAGYGVTGTMGAGYHLADGRLRAGTQTIDRVDGVVVWCKAERGGSPLELCIGPGDSGGPLFIGAGSDARLAAINSFQSGKAAPLKSRYGEETGHIAIPAIRQWIDSVMGE